MALPALVPVNRTCVASLRPLGNKERIVASTTALPINFQPISEPGFIPIRVSVFHKAEGQHTREGIRTAILDEDHGSVVPELVFGDVDGENT